jgi:GNAT superfamily N-acetyltransferase
MYEAPKIRDAAPTEASALESLQRRSSEVWDEYREQLAVDASDTPIGFSVVIPSDGPAHELDGLFVEPAQMRRGVGRALVEDASARAKSHGALVMDVTAGPAQPFYERAGFTVTGPARTRFGTAVRMRLDLSE